MAWQQMTKEETNQVMGEAAASSEAELEKLMKEFTPEQLEAVRKVAAWYKNNYLKAGYKRLTQALWKLNKFSYQQMY